MNALRTVLDEGPWTGFRKRIGLFAILAVILDGFDIQLVGVAIPALMHDWAVPRSAFVPVIALSLIAMSTGTAIAGLLGDRLGRRSTLIGSMLLFGVATFGTIFAHSVTMFLVWRVIASLGLGGAMPNAVALLSEFTPRRRRSFVVTLGMISTPLGGVMAGMVAATLLQPFGWRSLFVIGGILPVLLGTVLLFQLPESPDFLRSKPSRIDHLRKLADKLGAVLTPADLQVASHATRKGYAALFTREFRKDTAMLWLCFLGVLTAAFCMFNWVPTLLGRFGYDPAVGGTGLAAFNFGGILGAICGAVFIDRYGSRSLTVPFAVLGVGAALATGVILAAGLPAIAIIAGLAVTGVFVAGLQPMLFAIAAHLYPDHTRATGVGAALAVGRLGAIASSAIGAVLIGIGSLAYFAFIAALMAVVLGALIGLRRHVPSRSKA